MAARSETGRAGAGNPIAGRRAHSREHLLRYRLAVVGSNAVEVTRSIGGFVCDRTMAGWEVTVVLADASDTSGARSLEILGATVLDLEASLSTPVHDIWPHAVAIAPELYTTDARVRRGVLECLDHGLIEVALCDGDLPAELAGRLDVVQHRLSVAARAFKRAALAAAGVATAEIGGTERLRCGELLLTGPWGGADLISAG
ncbi:hypothetical protein [Nocardia sp. BMG51109]|uniref:hypothetical protein n=1 Tax=Nocardia sp. BMG51109 TaxID=1056816 RepID=UPI0004BC13FC|nr:hypothetical protein [Nocardia sp. BMG51109]